MARETGQAHSSHGHGGDNNSVRTLRRREHEEIGAFAVSGETLYAEYKRQLFKWHPGDANGRTPDWWILASRPLRMRNMGSS